MRTLEAEYCASCAQFGDANNEVDAALHDGNDRMTDITEAERRLAILQAERIGLVLPAAAVDGVVRNQRLLARHHAALRGGGQ